MKFLTSMFTYVSCFLLFGALFFIESKLPISNPYIYKSIRYLVLALVTFVTFKKRKLSLWIFTSMILGIEVGIDFLEGRDVNHDVVYGNLTYEQYRWDNRNLYYYIDDDGQLVVRISEEYLYPTGI